MRHRGWPWRLQSVRPRFLPIEQVGVQDFQSVRSRDSSAQWPCRFTSKCTCSCPSGLTHMMGRLQSGRVGESKRSKNIHWKCRQILQETIVLQGLRRRVTVTARFYPEAFAHGRCGGCEPEARFLISRLTSSNLRLTASTQLEPCVLDWHDSMMMLLLLSGLR